MVMTRSQAKKASVVVENGRMTRSKMATMVVPEEPIPRNPIMVRDLIKTNPTEAMDYLAYKYGAKVQYMRSDWQYEFLVKILKDFTVGRILRVFQDRLSLSPYHFKELTTREEILELFFKKFFNETMEQLSKNINTFIRKNLY
jgi:hypothetical protein